MTLAGAVVALAIGAAMGVLGGGGTLVAIPAFTFLLHLPPKEAVVTSLAVVGLASAAGATAGLIRGAIPASVAVIVGAAASAGAFAGGRLGARLDDHTQLAILSGVMFGAAVALLAQASGRAAVTRKPTKLILIWIGLAVGLLTGIVGVGGGFLMVPALAIAGGLAMREAAAVSLFVIALAAFSGLAGYVGQVHPRWPAILPMAAIAATGTVAGGAVAGRLPQRPLQQAFAVSLVILGSLMLTRL